MLKFNEVKNISKGEYVAAQTFSKQTKAKLTVDMENLRCYAYLPSYET